MLQFIRASIAKAPLAQVLNLKPEIWATHFAGGISGDFADAVSQAVHAREAAPEPAPPLEPRTYVGSRPRSPESLKRRHKWARADWLSPEVAEELSDGEAAAVAVIAAQHAATGDCRLPYGTIGALAGVCPTTVRNGVNKVRAGGALTVELRPRPGNRNLPNIIRIIATGWLDWLCLRTRKSLHGGGFKFFQRKPKNRKLEVDRSLDRPLFDSKSVLGAVIGQWSERFYAKVQSQSPG